MSATIHQLSPSVDRQRLLEHARDTNAAGLFLMRLYFERLDCFGEHDRYAQALFLVQNAIRESVRKDRRLWEGTDTAAQIERLKYLHRIDLHMQRRESDPGLPGVVVKFPSKRIVRRRKAKRTGLDPTDQPMRFSRSADPQAATQDPEKA